jgi:hypothetical protein
MRLAVRVLFGLVVAVLAGCRTAPELPANAPKPGVRASLRDVSFLPPQEPGWLLTDESADRMVYTNEGRNRDHQFAASVALGPLPPAVSSDEDFLAWVGSSKLASEPRRRKLTDGEREWDQGHAAKCVRYRSVVEDYTVRNAQRAPFVLVTTYGLACRHPKDAKLLVDTFLSERGVFEDVTPQVAEKMAASFLESVRFR